MLYKGSLAHKNSTLKSSVMSETLKMNQVQKIRESFRKLTNSKDLFVVEKFVLKPFGLWPCQKFKPKRIYFCAVFISLYIIFPQINNLIRCLSTGDYVNGTTTVPRILSNLILIFSSLNILFHQSHIEALIISIESIWYKYSSDEFPEWNVQRSRIVNIRSKCIIFTLSAVHSGSICAFYIPTLYKTLAFIFSNLEITDPSIERDTFWKVE